MFRSIMNMKLACGHLYYNLCVEECIKRYNHFPLCRGMNILQIHNEVKKTHL